MCLTQMIVLFIQLKASFLQILYLEMLIVCSQLPVHAKEYSMLKCECIFVVQNCAMPVSEALRLCIGNTTIVKDLGMLRIAWKTSLFSHKKEITVVRHVERNRTRSEEKDTRGCFKELDESVRYIQDIYQIAKDNHSNSDVENVFMTDIRIRKFLLIMGKEIDAITLDGRPGARSYLIRCSNTDHIRTTGNPVDFFLSSTLNTGSIRLCQKCYSAKRNQLQKDNRRQQNLNEQIQPGSHCPISTLSPRHLKMRYDNMREELLTLKHTCTSLNRKLETLLHIEDEEILEEKDPNGYELVCKVSKFINENTNNAYQSIFTAIMENMCKSNTEKHMVLSDEEWKQCGDFASVILEQMQSNAKKSQKMKRVFVSLHASYEWHFQYIRGQKLDTKRCAKHP